jgi:hypothetical protein
LGSSFAFSTLWHSIVTASRATLSSLSSHWKLVAGLICAVLMLVADVSYRAEQRQRDRVMKMAVEERAKALNAAVGQLESERQLVKQLSAQLAEFVKQVQVTDKRTRVAGAGATVAKIHDQIKITPDPGVTKAAADWTDDHHRFHFHAPDGPLDRTQLFKYQAVIVDDPAGAVLGKAEFTELDPVTGQPIPGVAPELQSSFSFVKPTPTAPALFHPRLVAAADASGGLGAGVEFANLERSPLPILHNLNLSAVALANRTTHDVRGAVQLGYRLNLKSLSSTISVGPSYGVSLKTGVASLGLGVTLEVTR